MFKFSSVRDSSAKQSQLEFLKRWLSPLKKNDMFEPFKTALVYGQFVNAHYTHFTNGKLQFYLFSKLEIFSLSAQPKNQADTFCHLQGS